MTQYAGIDYGLGQTNIDKKTGIRFGVIPSGEIGQAWYESSEADYGSAHCPKCGNEAKEFETVTRASDPPGKWVSVETIIPDEIEEKYEFAKYESHDYYCDDCKYVFGSESAFPDEVQAFTYIQDGYRCFQSGDGTDIFIELSPYYTHAQFCSPCAPGAGHLLNPFVNKWENSGTEQKGVMKAEEYPKDYRSKAQAAGFPKVYCFDHSWYWDTEEKRAPYPVFKVADDSIVLPTED